MFDVISMSKQHFEGYISKALREYQGQLWSQKNMVMPLAYHQSVGDFIILTQNHNYVLECKECKDSRFSLDRLTQLNDLKIFQNKIPGKNIGLVGLLFWNGRLDKSNIYIIPLNYYIIKLNDWQKKSFTELECEAIFKICKLDSIDNLGEMLVDGSLYSL